jgi:hypothetical protein
MPGLLMLGITRHGATERCFLSITKRKLDAPNVRWLNPIGEWGPFSIFKTWHPFSATDRAVHFY